MNIKVNKLDLPNEKYDYKDTMIYKIYKVKDLEIAINDMEDKGRFMLNQFNQRKKCINN